MSEAAFDAFVKRCAPGALEAHAEDLYLACGCAEGDRAALEIFERELLSQVPQFIARTDSSPAFADEVKQAVREKLWVGPRPAIAEYGGSGPLGAWLRIVAARTALNLKRGKAPAGDPFEVNAAQPDPELDYLKARYGQEFREAFRRVLGALPPRDKSLLSLYYLEGLSSTAIAHTFKVHAATVRRWVDDARARIVDETYQLLKERLDLSSKELHSLLKLLQSQLEQSIAKFLE